MKKHIEVVAAVIQQNEKYLTVQRGEHEYEYISLRWEFPGGKVEAGETLEAAMQRELREELLIDVSHLKPLMTVTHEYPHFHITMHCFLCVLQSPEITLTEHVDSRWLTREELWSVDWAAADIPAVEALEKQATQ